MKSEIYVVSHKKAKMPQDEIYCPVQVGSAEENFEGFFRDNIGNNIAKKNGSYCEITAQYWAANNRHADVKGIVHYRRFFSNGKSNFFKSIDKKFADIMTKKTLENLMNNYDMILPKKRNYYIETTWSQYEHVHNIRDLEIVEDIIKEKYPKYVPAFEKWMKKKAAHKFNMFIAKEKVFDDYTKWLMDILEEAEKSVDISNYTPYEKRVFGFLSELLIDVWIETNNINYVEIPVMFIGKQYWIKKISSFLIRKVKG